MSKKLPNIIAAEHLENVAAWQLPSMDGSENVIPSAEKERRDRAGRADEVIEDVEDEESLMLSPITAEELQEITEAAEREGFDEGKKLGLEQGQKEGHDTGYQAGLEQAKTESTEVLERQVSQLLQIAEALISPIDDQQTQLQQTMLQYVTILTEQVIERELIQDSSHILSCVKQSIASLPVGAMNIKIILNPDDLALVESYSEEYDKGWRFQGDQQLLPGGCRIETQESLVDFSVESKMKAMFSQFLQGQLTDASIRQAPESEPEPEPEVSSEVENSGLQENNTGNESNADGESTLNLTDADNSLSSEQKTSSDENFAEDEVTSVEPSSVVDNSQIESDPSNIADTDTDTDTDTDPDQPL